MSLYFKITQNGFIVFYDKSGAVTFRGFTCPNDSAYWRSEGLTEIIGER